eukprot:snap_masked-scaffold_2-processed-gene-19.25-mRNA-1 protein AED:1.00 eAED:1.00 QI:0/-1/0/0/-1/1/1/0/742
MNLEEKLALQRSSKLLLRALQIERLIAIENFAIEDESVTVNVGNEKVILISFEQLLDFVGAKLQDSQVFNEKQRETMKSFWDKTRSELQQSHDNFVLSYSYWRQRFFPCLLRSQTSFSNLIRGGVYEQQLCFEQLSSFPGHPFHPMTKTKLNLTPDEVKMYCPEFGNTVNLVFVPIRKECIRLRFCTGENFEFLKPLCHRFLTRKSSMYSKELLDAVLTILRANHECDFKEQLKTDNQKMVSLSEKINVKLSNSVSNQLNKCFESRNVRDIKVELYNEFLREQYNPTVRNFFIKDVSKNYTLLPVHPKNVETIRTKFQSLINRSVILLDPENLYVLECRSLMSFRTLIPTQDKFRLDELTAEKLYFEGAIRNDEVHKTGNIMGPFSCSHHIKLPVAVQATSQLRYLSPVEAHDSPIVTDFLNKAVKGSNLYSLNENIGVYFDYHSTEKYSYEDARYLSAIFREDPEGPMNKLAKKHNVPFSSLVVLPLGSLFCPFALDNEELKSLITLLVDPLKIRKWFTSYMELVTSTVMRLYLRYGCMIEAHQQNLLLVLDSTNGGVLGLLYRDMAGGVYSRENILKLTRSRFSRLEEHVCLNSEVPEGISFDMRSKLHYRQDSVCHGSDSIPLNQFLHTFLTHNVLPVMSALSRDRMKSDKTSLRSIAVAAMLCELENGEKQAMNFDDALEKKIYLKHIDETKKAIFENNLKHKCLLSMRLLSTKEEMFIEKPNLFKSLAVCKKTMPLV